jgi:hypothetical protein
MKPPPFIVLVCGGRDYNNWPRLRWVLSNIHQQRPITRLIHGNARGTDKLAGKWAKIKGVMCKAYDARWKELGRSAGHIRNAEMLKKEPRIHRVIAFPGGPGTQNMCMQAKAKGIKVIHIKDK